MKKKAIRYSYKSDIGMIRSNNEDCLFACYENNIGLFIVADGIGGYRAGEVASKIAIDTVSKVVIEHMNKIVNSQDSKYSIDKQIVYDIITYGFSLASEKIGSLGRKYDNLRGMGTTITLALIMETKNDNGSDCIYVANVGDSAAYLISNKSKKISENILNKEEVKNAKCNIIEDNHNMMQMVRLTRQSGFPPINGVDYASGTNCGPKYPLKEHIVKYNSSRGRHYCENTPFLTHVKWDEDDYLLLCTDGLTDMLDDNDICSTIMLCKEKLNFSKGQCIKLLLDETCKALIDKANESGGNDNITILLARRG